jgi:glycosyltransferase involved in cell wall biosynthesis
VAAQSVKPLEVIAVDDASSDGTYAALLELQGRHGPDWLRLVRLGVNRGAGPARNAGWTAARAEWIAFLDADDAWHPRKLEIQTGVLRDHPEADLAAHRYQFAGRPIPSTAPAVSWVSPGALLWSNRFVTPSVMLRRNLTRRFNEHQTHMEDHLLWMQLAFDGCKMVLIHVPLVTLYKPSFGASGLSADLIAMERAELGNYGSLRRNGQIGSARWLVLCGWSALKFLRRLLVVGLRQLGR